MELKDEPHVAVAERDDLAVAQPVQPHVPDVNLPVSAWSSPPSRCSSVLLPTPDAPTTATISPASTLSERPRSTGSRASHGVALVEIGDGQERHAALSRSQRVDGIQPRRLSRR